jgi:hypothetical protein
VVVAQVVAAQVVAVAQVVVAAQVVIPHLGLIRGISWTTADSRHLAGGVLNNKTVIKL